MSIDRVFRLSLIDVAIICIAGGIILGFGIVARDIMIASRAASQVAQINKYDSYVDKFIDKYKSLPGDLANANTLIDNAKVKNGNGDGLLQNSQGKLIYKTTADGEREQFWLHLNYAGFLFDNLEMVRLVHSPKTIGKSGNITVGYEGSAPKMGWNDRPLSFILSKLKAKEVTESSQGKVGDNNSLFSPIFSAQEAFMIDYKMDDGRPLSGRVYIGPIAIKNLAMAGQLNACLAQPDLTYSGKNSYSNNALGQNCLLVVDLQNKTKTTNVIVKVLE